jgi:hypothetical protein
MPQHLLPEIRATVDYDIVALCLDQHRDPQAFIPGVLAQADRIRTPDDGDSLRGSGAEKGDLQPLVYFIQIYNLFITWIGQSF